VKNAQIYKLDTQQPKHISDVKKAAEEETRQTKKKSKLSK